MQLNKYVLLLDADAGPLVRLGPCLRECNWRMISVTHPVVALEVVRSFPKLAMLAIGVLEGSDSSATLLMDIRSAQPRLPLLWTHAESYRRLGRDSGPLLHEGVTARDLVRHSESLLCEHFYPPELADCVMQAVIASLESFGTPATCIDPFLKANHLQLAELSSVITFTGPLVSGHVAISGPRTSVLPSYSSAMGETVAVEDQRLRGLLGECANQVVGRLMQYLEPSGAVATFGLPTHDATTPFGYGEGAAMPALAMEFATAHGSLFSEVCITSNPPTSLPA